MESQTVPAAANHMPSPDADWWRHAVVYQIYPRSFFDTNGDGVGDLKGVAQKAPYLESLGVDAVWLSPFYPSPLADGGYDVADYRDVDARLGTLQDFDDMVAALHARGIRVLVDIVPNHTSDQHAWFQEALSGGPGSPARQRYMFRRGDGEEGERPPADWRASFGGPAWNATGDGDWYFHNFAPEQPDLNWRNEDVKEDFLRTLRFWSDRGVDGFRVDMANMLAKDFPDQLPNQEELDALPWDGHHPLYDREEVHDIYAEWREVFDSYDPPRMAVAEAWAGPESLVRYASPRGLGQTFNFDLMRADFDAAQFKAVISAHLDLAERAGSSPTWVLSNHDIVRHATRFGLPDSPRDEHGSLLHASGAGFNWLRSGGLFPQLDRVRGERRARAATLLMLALPGSAYLYQGEELGLHEAAGIPPESRQDPTFLRTKGEEIGRDGCRVPLPWAPNAPNFGFSPQRAHLPQPEWFVDYTAEGEDADPNSTLNLYRAALRLRHELQPGAQLSWIELPQEGMFAFHRSDGWRVLTNFRPEPVSFLDVPASLRPGDHQIALASLPISQRTGIPGECSIWFRP